MNPVNRLLIVDDDHGLVNLLKRFLEGEGFHVDAAYDQASGLSAALSHDHELIILDVMLPGGSGFELLKALRVQSSVPVLLLTARGEAVDRILGLEIGAQTELFGEQPSMVNLTGAVQTAHREWQCEQDGYKAGKAGEPIDNNPHPGGSPYFTRWRAGWQDGQAALAVGMKKPPEEQ